MKTKKLIAASALALSMTFAPAVSMLNALPVLAEEANATHTITINNATEGATYTAYQIFTGTTLPATEGENDQTVIYQNLADIQWGTGITEDGKTELYSKYNLTGDEQSAQKVAEQLTNEAKAREFASLVNQYLTNGASSSPVSEGSTSTTITVSGDGYYLIKDATGSTANPTESILKVVNDVTVTPKTTDVPQYEKKVQENVKEVTGNPEVVPVTDNNSEKMNDVADYNIGDLVPFELAAVAPTAEEISSYNEYKFVFHDKMDAGLTLKQDTIKVYVGNSTTPLTKDVDYTLTTPTTPATALTDGDTFDVEVKIKGKDSQNKDITGRAGEKIRVTFTATLNSNAKLDKEGNENSFILEYSNNPTTGGTGKTEPDEVVVFTYHMDLNKVDGADKSTALSGAEFKLYRMNGTEKEYLKANRNGTSGVYTVTGWTATEGEATVLKATQTDGNIFTINGLDDGTYLLKETKAPAGYQTPSTDFELILAATTTNDQNYAGDPDSAITDIKLNGVSGTSANIENTKGHELPETGGMGTTMLYGVGGLLVAGAAVVFITNKRTSKN